MHVRLDPRLGEPLARALMRVEGRLMLQDAERIGRPSNEPRTHEQRAADALVDLVQSVADAARTAQE